MFSHAMRTIGWGAVLLLAALMFPSGAHAMLTNTVGVRYFPDVTTVLGGQTFDDEDVAHDYLNGSVTQISIGAIPASAALTAYHVRAGGTQVVSFDTTLSLPGGLVAEPRDVVQTNFDGTAAYTMVFDGSANGVPSGVMVNAIGFTSNVGGDILLTFDTTVALPGGITANDEDLVRLTGSSFTLFFDGSAAGVPEGLDLDGVNYVAANGHLLLSFDGSGTVGSVSFDAEDVLEYAPGSGLWLKSYDGSTEHPGWEGANLGGANLLTDVDVDGLADEFETNTGTFVSIYDTGSNPLLADTDGDGYSDGAEVAAGTNPNNAQSFPSIPALGPRGVALFLMLATGAYAIVRRRRAARVLA